MKYAIVGCGISGAATAMMLAERGHEVEVFEAQKTFGGAVLKSSALVYPIREDEFQEDWEVTEACNHFTQKIVEKMESEWGEKVLYEPLPGLVAIHTDEEMATALDDVKTIPTARVISLEEGRQICPHFADHLKGFVMFENGYAADPYSTVRGLVRRGKAHGAQYHFNTQVQKIDRQHRVWFQGEHGREQRQFDRVICCNGADVSRLLMSVGVHCPVFPVHGQMFTLKPPKGFTLNCMLSSYEKSHVKKKLGGLLITHQHIGDNRKFRHLYGRQRTNAKGQPGNLIFGGDRVAGNLGYMYEEGHESVRNHVSELLPILKDHCSHSGHHQWFGNMPWTHDEKPVIGQCVPGIYVLSGLCAHGFATGIGAAQLLVEHIDGTPHSILSQANPLRFTKHNERVLAKL